jgi:hypothetical protein
MKFKVNTAYKIKLQRKDGDKRILLLKLTFRNDHDQSVVAEINGVTHNAISEDELLNNLKSVDEVIVGNPEEINAIHENSILSGLNFLSLVREIIKSINNERYLLYFDPWGDQTLFQQGFLVFNNQGKIRLTISGIQYLNDLQLIYKGEYLALKNSAYIQN